MRHTPARETSFMMNAARFHNFGDSAYNALGYVIPQGCYVQPPSSRAHGRRSEPYKGSSRPCHLCALCAWDIVIRLLSFLSCIRILTAMQNRLCANKIREGLIVSELNANESGKNLRRHGMIFSLLFLF